MSTAEGQNNEQKTSPEKAQERKSEQQKPESFLKEYFDKAIRFFGQDPDVVRNKYDEFVAAAKKAAEEAKKKQQEMKPEDKDKMKDDKDTKEKKDKEIIENKMNRLKEALNAATKELQEKKEPTSGVIRDVVAKVKAATKAGEQNPSDDQIKGAFASELPPNSVMTYAGNGKVEVKAEKLNLEDHEKKAVGVFKDEKSTEAQRTEAGRKLQEEYQTALDVGLGEKFLEALRKEFGEGFKVSTEGGVLKIERAPTQGKEGSKEQPKESGNAMLDSIDKMNLPKGFKDFLKMIAALLQLFKEGLEKGGGKLPGPAATPGGEVKEKAEVKSKVQELKEKLKDSNLSKEDALKIKREIDELEKKKIPKIDRQYSGRKQMEGDLAGRFNGRIEYSDSGWALIESDSFVTPDGRSRVSQSVYERTLKGYVKTGWSADGKYQVQLSPEQAGYLFSHYGSINIGNINVINGNGNMVNQGNGNTINAGRRGPEAVPSKPEAPAPAPKPAPAKSEKPAPAPAPQKPEVKPAAPKKDIGDVMPGSKPIQTGSNEGAADL